MLSGPGTYTLEFMPVYRKCQWKFRRESLLDSNVSEGIREVVISIQARQKFTDFDASSLRVPGHSPSPQDQRKMKVTKTVLDAASPTRFPRTKPAHFATCREIILSPAGF
jgi:hypothetical protein